MTSQVHVLYGEKMYLTCPTAVSTHQELCVLGRGEGRREAVVFAVGWRKIVPLGKQRSSV